MLLILQAIVLMLALLVTLGWLQQVLAFIIEGILGNGTTLRKVEVIWMSFFWALFFFLRS